MAANDITPYVNQFNSSASWLINLVRKMHPTNAVIDRAVGRVNIGKQTDPLILLNTIGPYLMKFSEDITSYDDKFVFNMDISTHTDDVSVHSIFKLLTTSYKGFKEKERNAVKDKINDMLDAYMSYLITIQ